MQFLPPALKRKGSIAPTEYKSVCLKPQSQDPATLNGAAAGLGPRSANAGSWGGCPGAGSQWSWGEQNRSRSPA